MSKGSIMALVLAGVLATTVAPVRAEKKSKDFEKGQAFCPSHVLVIGGTIIQAGRCYMLAVLRNDHGTFLAFLNPSVERSRGPIRLNSEDGRRVSTKVIYLVPIGASGISAAVIPVNTVRLVGIHEEDRDEDEGENDNDEHNNVGQGNQKVVLVVTGIPIPNLAVTFIVRL
ncbi:MAG: hypothetical protein AUH31_07200 [Armatimonadetes bacterium 13_1_40CM_64_14]|nr:MAG: hypothetical protein AUH31_07200 [Armatimonadetes bacterium 13_1_40CM_64_14]